MTDEQNLVDILNDHARKRPNQRVYTYIADGDADEVHLSFQELDLQARALAIRLKSLVAPGDRALLLYPSGLEYITAFFGCLYTGVIPVPAYPPRLNRIDQRIQAISNNAQAAIALTTADIMAGMERRSSNMPALENIGWVSTTYPESTDGIEGWEKPDISEDSLAFIQYTSGSTASPKGVMVSHGNIIHNLSSIKKAFEIDPKVNDIGVSWAPLYHDSGLILSALMAVYAGGQLVFMSPTAFAQRPARWLEAITRHKGTISGGPNFALQWCIDRTTPEERAALDLSSWRVAFTGAEPIRSETLNQFTRTFGPCGFRPEAFTPGYGLAESTLMVSSKHQSKNYTTYFLNRQALESGKVVVEDVSQIEFAREFVGCGEIFPDQKVLIVDPATMIELPEGQVGEVWVSSASVAQGYWANVDETRAIFHAHLKDRSDQTFLRTGDLGFIRDGELVITGRLKDIIIINGRNFYAEDIELTIRDIHPALQPDAGAAFAVEIDGGERLVIVCEVKREYRHANVDEVSRVIRRAIAENHELAVDDIVLIKPLSMPRTTSNKIQRSACKSDYLLNSLERIKDLNSGLQSSDAVTREQIAIEPRTPIEASLCFIWAEVLGIEKVGVQENFFALGGTSLIATQIASRVEDFFNVELPLSILFETPTVANLANLIEKKSLQEKIWDTGPILRVDHTLPIPCSFAQERMWFLHQLDPTSSAYNLPMAVRLTGPLDLQAIKGSLLQILDRHESLRTSFSLVEDQPFQLIRAFSPDLFDEIFELIDLRNQPAGERKNLALRLVNEEARRPFKLNAETPIRLRLLQVEEYEHIIVINMHHIISDAWSINQLVREFLIFYNTLTSRTEVALPELPVQYVDYAAWQRQRYSNGVLKKELSYWRHQLEQVSILELPADHPRPDIQTYHGSAEIFDLDETLLDKLKLLSRNHESTLFMTLLTAFAVLLYRYTGLTDLAIGVPVANRNRLETENLIGVLVNTIVMRLNLNNNPTFLQLLKHVRKTSLEAFDHQELPFSKLISELQPERDTRHTPITQILFNLVDVQTPPLNLNELEIEPLQIDRQGAQFDLTLSVTDISTERSIAIEYNTDLFEKSTISRMMKHYVQLLKDIVMHGDRTISQLKLLTEPEISQLLLEWNDTFCDYPVDLVVPDLFEEQVDRTPESVAVIFDDTILTYKALNRRANRLAHHLRSIGTKPGKLVGINLNRSPEMLVAILAVLKAGGAYVPLDPTFPPSRLTYMIKDAEIDLLLTHSEFEENLPPCDARLVYIDKENNIIPEECYENPERLLISSDLVYVIYTSGSTGRPKGVQINHRAVVNFLLSMADKPGIHQEDTLLAVTTMSFDIALLELMLPLTVGARVVIGDRNLAYDGKRLAQMIDQHAVTIMQATPITWEILLESGWQGAERLKMLCGGEALRKELARKLVSKGSELWNMYGPTETTIWSSLERVYPGEEDISVGRPIANTDMYVLDSDLQPVPVGVTGMLYIGGIGLSPGYCNSPDLTEKKFIKHPFKTSDDLKVYQTGDLAKFLPDGRIKWLGRSDHQIKIRGFRIELGEIESALTEHSAVKRAIVSTYENGDSNLSLVAYCIPDNSPLPNATELRSFLREKLPEYMVPSSYIPIASIPLTPNGKVNYQELPIPQFLEQDIYVHPRNSVERELLKIWENVLNVHPIGIRSNFFSLGGHSLLAIRLLNRVEAAFRVNLPIATIFQSPTIEEMALIVQGKVAPPDWSVLVPIQKGGSQRPIFCVHGAGGGIMGYAALAKALGNGQPFYGLQAKGVDSLEEPHDRIEEMAAYYIQQIQRIQPTGPYDLAGYSFGGFVAFEMACQLKDQGHKVGLLAMLDTYALSREAAIKMLWKPGNLIKFLMNLPAWIRDEIVLLFVRNSTNTVIPERKRVLNAHIEALKNYHLRKYDGTISLFRVKTFSLLRSFDPDYGWGEVAEGGVNHYIVSGSHFNMLEEPFVEKLAEQIKKSLAVERSTNKP